MRWDERPVGLKIFFPTDVNVVAAKNVKHLKKSLMLVFELRSATNVARSCIRSNPLFLKSIWKLDVKLHDFSRCPLSFPNLKRSSFEGKVLSSSDLEVHVEKWKCIHILPNMSFTAAVRTTVYKLLYLNSMFEVASRDSKPLTSHC